MVKPLGLLKVDADYVLNTLLYGLYFSLWASTTLGFILLALKYKYFIFGAIFISANYLPGQITDYFLSPGRLLLVEFLLAIAMLSVFLSSQKLLNDIRLIARTFMLFALLMMCVNAVTVVAPGFMEYLASKAGTIEGYNLTVEFIRIQMLNALFAIQCISLAFFAFMDVKRIIKTEKLLKQKKGSSLACSVTG